MRRAAKIGVATSAVIAAGVITGGMLAVGQELKVDDNPGEQLTLQGVETGVAAQDAAGAVSGARIRAEGTTPKVQTVVEQPVVDEVPPADPVVIAPRRAAPAAPPAPAPASPAQGPKHDDKWGTWNGHGDGKWGEPPQPKQEAPKPAPAKPGGPDGPRQGDWGGGGGGHGGGGHKHH